MNEPIDSTHTFLNPTGLVAAKCMIGTDDPTVLDLFYYHDVQAEANDHAPRHLSFKSNNAVIQFPGRYSLTLSNGSDTKVFEVDVSANGPTGFDITVTESGVRIAQGLAVIDPNESRSLLISGWTGDAEPYGIAKYTIRDSQTVDGYYLSKMSPDQPGRDKAVGDTTNGFPGQYSLTTLEVNGRTWGPHDWRLTQRGEVIDLVWREQGAVICRGFSIVDPQDANSIIVNYVPVNE